MPIELKKPISNISGLTCENCIHYQKSGEDWCCINPDSYNWWRDKEECCSLGVWFRVYRVGDTSELSLDAYASLMYRFMKEKLDATKN